METQTPGPLVQLQRAPSINRVIDNTALAAYMSCPRKYFFSMVLHRRGRGAPTPSLSYGTAWHAALEAHYKTGGDKNAVVKAIIMSWRPHSKPDDYRTPERCIAAYDEYLSRWGSHDEDSRNYGATVGYPHAPIVETPTEIGSDSLVHPYAGKIDRIIQLQGLYYVEDHKTSSALGSYWAKEWDPSNQMIGYAWLAWKLTGLPIAGVRINAHGVLKTQNKFDRALISYGKDRLLDWEANYNSWIVRLNEAYELAERLGEVGDSAAAFPMNLNACYHKYGACGYVDVCTSPPSLRSRILEADYEVTPWDPMNPDGDAEPVRAPTDG